jgi:hypothetical protein
MYLNCFKYWAIEKLLGESGSEHYLERWRTFRGERYFQNAVGYLK